MANWLEEGQNEKTKVVSVVNGSEQEHEFSPETKLKDVVKKVAREKGFGAVTVKTDGHLTDPEDGEKQISEFELVEVLPKHVGA